ncbi:hypothetical protein B0H11DRAFT_1937703 [Mycena galericulata]|nr:hypothetical protein B0H11DRAFT_1937703 [Mycena galericulata]
MPRLTSRQRRARDVLKAFLGHHTARLKNALRRKSKSKRNFARAGLTPEEIDHWQLPTLGLAKPTLDALSIDMTSGSEPDLEGSSASSISSSLSSYASESSEDWSDILGSGWRHSSSGSSASSTHSLFESDSDDSMPELHPAGYPDSDEEDDVSPSSSDSSSETGSASRSGDDADDEEAWDLDDIDIADDWDDLSGRRTNNPARWVRNSFEEICPATPFPVAPPSYDTYSDH